jgi:hypothetical protein
MAKRQLKFKNPAICIIAAASIIALALVIGFRLPMASASRLDDTASGWDFKGAAYISWLKGEYPFAISWVPQTYSDSQAITAASVTTYKPSSGVGSLEMAVDLIGSDPNNNKRNGEVFVNLRYHPPLCNPPDCVTAPVNFEGVTITAKVFAPIGSRGDLQRPNGYLLFVKDKNWKSFYGSWQNINEGTWTTVTVIPGRTAPPGGWMDSGFDPTQVVLLGLKIGAGTGSTATFSGTVWLDDVDWAGGQHPKYPFENVENSLDELKKTGANYVELINTWYMDSPASNVIYSDSAKTHTDDEIIRTIQETHSRTMKVLLKPHIDVQDGTWRGNISPSDSAVWCVNYTNFITHFAEIAQNTGVDLFSVGTELASMSGSPHRACWDTLIDAVRSVYTGTLTYAANWDEYKNVSFWDRLDIVGIDAYFPLSDARDPTVTELMDGWISPTVQMENWQATIGKPVIFTEIGYRNVDYCAKEPWSDSALPSNCECQARAYGSALKAFADKPWFRGMFWWNWFPWSDGGSCCETTFTPQNKLAQQILTREFSGVAGYSLTVNAIGSGVVTPSGTTTYPFGTIVTLTAVPSDTFVFAGWRGAAAGLTNPVTVTMDADKAVTATFTIKTVIYTPIIASQWYAFGDGCSAVYFTSTGSIDAITLTARYDYPGRLGGGLPRRYDIKQHGGEVYGVRVRLCYSHDDLNAAAVSLASEGDLHAYHYEDGSWAEYSVVDTVNNTITAGPVAMLDGVWGLGILLNIPTAVTMQNLSAIAHGESNTLALLAALLALLWLGLIFDVGARRSHSDRC